jgi:hypothetical protein
MKSRVQKRLIATLVIAACAVITYIGLYIFLTFLGDYRASQTGMLRYGGAFAVTDVYHWQPRFMWWEPFRNIRGEDTTRANALGYFYSPLIRLERYWFRPSKFIFESPASTQPTG